jgi:YVTN family beta-propeller protein
MRIYTIPSCLLAGLLMSGCGGDNSNSDSGNTAATASGPRVLGTTAITGVGAGTNFGFDLGLVVGNRYYVTDRNNAAVDVFDTANSTQVGQIKGTGANAFAGLALKNGAVDNSASGPDGINAVGNLLYAGDVNSVKVIDPAAQQVIKTIPVGTSGKRADEGCVDAAHSLYMISTPEADPPFATFINATTQTVVAQVTFTDASGAPAAGLEQCRYDTTSDTFFVNNDGTTANPHGELVAMPGASIRAIAAGRTVNYTALAGVRLYSEGNCDPTGLALGPDNDIAVGCREATTGAPLLVQIMDRTNGRILASVNAGGGDQIEYDASTNRYYNAGSRWTASGNAATGGNCSAASPCTPVLSIIDAATRTVVTKIPTGNNAHSVAVDPVTAKAFLPISSGPSPAGCATCTTEPAGLLTIATQ